MKYIISVSKTYKHRGKHEHKRAKKHWFIYYFDEEGKLHSEMVNFLQVVYYKTRKWHRMKFVCLECGEMFVGLAKSKNDSAECPYCD